MRVSTISCINLWTYTHTPVHRHTHRFHHALETDFLMKPSPSESRAEIHTGPFLPSVHPPLLAPSLSLSLTFCTSFVLFMFGCLSLLSQWVKSQPLIYGYRQRQFYKQTGWWEGMTENIRAERHVCVCVNLKMSVTVFLSMVIYIRNDKCA